MESPSLLFKKNSLKRNSSITISPSEQTSPCTSKSLLSPQCKKLKMSKKKLDFEQQEKATKSIDHESAGPSGIIDELKNKKLNENKKNNYVRKIKDFLYDSDEYEKSDLPKMPKLSKWVEDKVNTDTGYQMKRNMWHLHYGVSVPYKNWKVAIKAKTPMGFLRELVVPHIWSREDFIKRAVQVERTNNKSDRVNITPRKKEALKRGYVQFLIENNFIKSIALTEEDKKKRDKAIGKFGRDLGVIISQERAKVDTSKAEGVTHKENNDENSDTSSVANIDESEDFSSLRRRVLNISYLLYIPLLRISTHKLFRLQASFLQIVAQFRYFYLFTTDLKA